jgi:hypothetical protein
MLNGFFKKLLQQPDDSGDGETTGRDVAPVASETVVKVVHGYQGQPPRARLPRKVPCGGCSKKA